MYFLLILLLIIILTVITIFSFKRFSPVPYFPSNSKDLGLIIKSLSLKNKQTVIDLGAGDGIIIFEAARVAHQKKINTKFVAVDINPILILILHIRRFFHPNKKNIKIVYGDMFKLDSSVLLEERSDDRILKDPIAHFKNHRSLQDDNDTMKQFNNITIYLYISPWFLDKISKKILKEFSKARIVSYMYPIKSLKRFETKMRGKNSIYIYS